LTAHGTGIYFANSASMPKYYFKVVDTTIVIDYGVHDLPDATAAQIEAIELARSLRESRADLLGRHCSVSVTDEDGGGVCIIPLEFE
jgi:hypothetical protein